MSKKTIKTFFAPAEFLELFKYSTGKIRECSQKLLSITLSANYTGTSMITPVPVSKVAATVASRKKNMLTIVMEQRQRIRQITFHFLNPNQDIEKLLAELKMHPTLLGMNWTVRKIWLENTENGKQTRWRNQRVNGSRSLMCYMVDNKTIDQLTYSQIMHAVGGFYEDACKVQRTENKIISWEHLPCKV